MIWNTSNAFIRAVDMFQERRDMARLQQCIPEALVLLETDHLPRAHRILTLALLGSCIEVANMANKYRISGEALWILVRRWHPEGDAATDSTIARFYAIIVELKQEIARELSAVNIHRAAQLEVLKAKKNKNQSDMKTLEYEERRQADEGLRTEAERAKTLAAEGQRAVDFFFSNKGMQTRLSPVHGIPIWTTGISTGIDTALDDLKGENRSEKDQYSDAPNTFRARHAAKQAKIADLEAKVNNLKARSPQIDISKMPSSQSVVPEDEILAFQPPVSQVRAPVTDSSNPEPDLSIDAEQTAAKPSGEDDKIRATTDPKTVGLVEQEAPVPKTKNSFRDLSGHALVAIGLSKYGRRLRVQ